MPDAIPCRNKDCKDGKVTKVDIIRAKSVTEVCPVCKGTGFEYDPNAKKEGLYLQPQEGQPFWMEWYEDDSLVSWAKIRVDYAVKVRLKNGQEITNKAMIESAMDRGNVEGVTDKWVVIFIDHIETKGPKRRQGLATNLLQQMMAMFNEQVRYIISGWADSSKIARACLMKSGFERKGTALVWTRPEKKEPTPTTT